MNIEYGIFKLIIYYISDTFQYEINSKEINEKENIFVKKPHLEN